MKIDSLMFYYSTYFDYDKTIFQSVFSSFKNRDKLVFRQMDFSIKIKNAIAFDHEICPHSKQPQPGGYIYLVGFYDWERGVNEKNS